MEKNNTENRWLAISLGLFGEAIGLIVFPIILGVFIGQYLDKIFKTEPIFFLIFVFASFAASIVLLASRLKKSGATDDKVEKNTK